MAKKSESKRSRPPKVAKAERVIDVEAVAAERLDLAKKLAACSEDLAKAKQERDEFQKAVKASDRAARTWQKEREALERKISGLIEENRRLAEHLEACEAERDRLRDAASESQPLMARLEQQLAEARKGRTKAEREAESTSLKLARAQAELEMARGQLQERESARLLPADTVADLIQRLIESMRSGPTGLDVRGGELRLRVGFGGAGELVGFALPTVGSGASWKEDLHELILRFGQTLTPTREKDAKPGRP